MLFLPLFFRGAAAVIISIVFLTSIVQSGLPFQVFPQALTINGFTGAVMGATLGPAIIGEFLRHIMAKNASLLGSAITDFNPDTAHVPLGKLYGLVQTQALVVSMKEIYGWLLIIAIFSLMIILVSYGPLRPAAFFRNGKLSGARYDALSDLKNRPKTPQKLYDNKQAFQRIRTGRLVRFYG